MGKITTCSGCRKQSPDIDTGLHVANGWLRVLAASNMTYAVLKKNDAFTFCDDCANPITSAISMALKGKPKL
jgi:hypothetical protein